MKKAAKHLARLAAAGAGGAVLISYVIDKLLVDRKWVMPDKFNDSVSGADMSDLHDLCEENMRWLENYGYENHSITDKNGVKLEAVLMRPAEPSDVYVFCAHGYRSTGKREFCGLAQYYLKKGYNVFLPDHPGAGESGGKYIGFGKFESDDGILWLDYLNDTFGSDIKIIMHGISMGSATVMLMSGREDLPENVKLIVSDCGYTSAWDEFDYKLRDMGVPVQPLLGMVNAVNKAVAGYDFRDTSAIDAVKKAKLPMLFIHGGGDTFVPSFMVTLVYDACGSEDKDILIVEGADHAQSQVTGKEEYEAKLDEFIGKYL